MFEEFALTYYNNEWKNELPPLLQIGSFNRETTQVPVLIPFDMLNGVCFETDKNSRTSVLNQMQYMAMQLIKNVHPELLHFTFIDIGNKTHFPIIYPLEIPHIRIINDDDSLENEVKQLKGVVRNISIEFGHVYTNISDFNKNKPIEKKEPYHIWFIANYPNGFGKRETIEINNLISTANEFGIKIIMNLDNDSFPKIDNYNKDYYNQLFESLTKMIHIDCTKSKVKLNNFPVSIIQKYLDRFPFTFESYSIETLENEINNINQLIKQTISDKEDFLSIPIGFSSRREIYLEMGDKSEVQHGLIAGISQMGKSTFLHNIITSIAEKYSPDDLRLYLLDYKRGGIEFGMYEKHPNVEILLKNNINAGLKVLHHLTDEMDERGKLFAELGTEIAHIKDYNKKATVKMPHILLIIDEAHILCMNTMDGNEANQYIEDLARQAAGFGIHILLSTHTYSDFKFDNTALEQMPLRMAFKIDNPNHFFQPDNYEAPLELSVGQIIYNKKHGKKEGNIVVRLNKIDKALILGKLENATKTHKFVSFEKKIITKSDNPFPEYDDIEIDMNSSVEKNRINSCEVNLDNDLAEFDCSENED